MSFRRAACCPPNNFGRLTHVSVREGNNPGNQNLAVWFCVRPGPTPFFAFGTPARFRVTGAASCGHYAAGAAGKKKLSPTTTNLVCDSREFATRSSPSTGYGRPPSLRAAVHCLRHYRFLTSSTDVSAARPAAQVHTAPVHGVRRPQPCSAREIGVWAGWEQAGRWEICP